MRENIVKIFDLPEESYVGKKIFKKLFYENHKFKPKERKFFSDDVQLITWLYSIKPETARIPVYAVEEKVYEEVAFIEVVLRGGKHTDDIIKIIHSSIPYPICLIVLCEERFLISLAHKRNNQLDGSKSVVERVIISDWFCAGGFLEKLQTMSFRNLPMDNLYSFYCSLVGNLVDLEYEKVIGRIEPNHCVDEKLKTLDVVALNRARVERLLSELKREEHLARKVELNIEIRKIQETIDEKLKG